MIWYRNNAFLRTQQAGTNKMCRMFFFCFFSLCSSWFCSSVAESPFFCHKTISMFRWFGTPPSSLRLCLRLSLVYLSNLSTAAADDAIGDICFVWFGTISVQGTVDLREHIRQNADPEQHSTDMVEGKTFPQSTEMLVGSRNLQVKSPYCTHRSSRATKLKHKR